jgi:phosphohistidine phosphatase
LLLLLIRHAEAANRDQDRWPDDTTRPLVGKGRKRHRRMARRLRRRGLVPRLLLASPLLRAWETAEITAEETGSPPPVSCEALAGPPQLERIATAIGRRDDDAVVGLVGHEPWLGELASLLLVGDGRLAVDFPKSGVLGLRLERVAAGAGTLDFFMRPRGGEAP